MKLQINSRLSSEPLEYTHAHTRAWTRTRTHKAFKYTPEVIAGVMGMISNGSVSLSLKTFLDKNEAIISSYSHSAYSLSTISCSKPPSVTTIWLLRNQLGPCSNCISTFSPVFVQLFTKFSFLRGYDLCWKQSLEAFEHPGYYCLSMSVSHVFLLPNATHEQIMNAGV